MSAETSSRIRSNMSALSRFCRMRARPPSATTYQVLGCFMACAPLDNSSSRWIVPAMPARPLHPARQERRQRGKPDQDDQPQEVGRDEGDDAEEDGGEADVLDDALDDEDVHADRRVDEAELDRHDDDDAEPDRIE